MNPINQSSSRYLDFDLGTLYKALSDYYYPKLLFGAELDPEKVQRHSLSFV